MAFYEELEEYLRSAFEQNSQASDLKSFPKKKQAKQRDSVEFDPSIWTDYSGEEWRDLIINDKYGAFTRIVNAHSTYLNEGNDKFLNLKNKYSSGFISRDIGGFNEDGNRLKKDRIQSIPQEVYLLDLCEALAHIDLFDKVKLSFLEQNAGFFEKRNKDFQEKLKVEAAKIQRRESAMIFVIENYPRLVEESKKGSAKDISFLQQYNDNLNLVFQNLQAVDALDDVLTVEIRNLLKLANNGPLLNEFDERIGCNDPQKKGYWDWLSMPDAASEDKNNGKSPAHTTVNPYAATANPYAATGANPYATIGANPYATPAKPEKAEAGDVEEWLHGLEEVTGVSHMSDETRKKLQQQIDERDSKAKTQNQDLKKITDELDKAKIDSTQNPGGFGEFGE